MGTRADSSASKADDWLPRIQKVVSLADPSLMKLHGHDCLDDYARVSDDVGNDHTRVVDDVKTETGWIEDKEEANSDGWIDSDKLNALTKHPDTPCPLPDRRNPEADFAGSLSPTLLPDANCRTGVENTVSDGHGTPIMIKREPEDFDHQCAQSFNAFPHGDAFKDEQDIAIKQETPDGDYIPDPYLCSSRGNVFPEKMDNLIATELESVPDGLMQRPGQFIQQPVLDPNIKRESTCSESTEQFGQTQGFDHSIKSEPDEPMVSHITEQSNFSELTENPYDQQAERSDTKTGVTNRHTGAQYLPVLDDKKQVLMNPSQSKKGAVPSTVEPHRPSNTAKFSSIDEYVEWLADYISKGNKSNIVLKGPTKLINDVTKKVNEKIELAKKAKSLAKESSEMNVQHPDANYSLYLTVPTTSTAPQIKWTSNGTVDQPHSQGLHFNDINQRPLLSTEGSNASLNNSHETHALLKYNNFCLTNSLSQPARSVPIVFVGDTNILDEPTASPPQYVCDISKTRHAKRVGPLPPRRSERERKGRVPFTPPDRADAKSLSLRRSGRERKVTRPYSPPPIKTKRTPTPAVTPVTVTATPTTPISHAYVAPGTRMSDMVRLQGDISVLPPQYRIISGACTKLQAELPDDFGTLGSIRNTRVPLNDIDNPTTEIAKQTVNVAHDDLNDVDIKPPSLLTLSGRANITGGELSRHDDNAYTTSPLNDRSVVGNTETETLFEPTRTSFQNDHDYEDLQPPLPLEDVDSRQARVLMTSSYQDIPDALSPVDEVGNSQTNMTVERHLAFPDVYDHGGGKPPSMLSGSARPGITVREMLQSSRRNSTYMTSPLHDHHDNDDDADDIKPPPPSLSTDAGQAMTVRELLRHKKRYELQERLKEQEKALEDLRRKRMEQIKRRKTDPDLSDLY